MNYSAFLKNFFLEFLNFLFSERSSFEVQVPDSITQWSAQVTGRVDKNFVTNSNIFLQNENNKSLILKP